MAITDTEARKAKAEEKAYKIADSEGLYLEVRPTGKKFWRYRFYVHKKEGVYTIGEYPSVTLAEARRERDWAKVQARSGANPNEVRRLEKADAESDNIGLFMVVTEEFASRKRASWSHYYANQFDRVMEKDCYPVIGKLSLREITPAHLLRIIESIEGRGAPSVAIMTRQWLSQIFRYGASKLLVDSDPTFVLREAIVRPPTRHNPPLERTELPVFFQKLNAYTGQRQTVLAIRLLAHTFVRTVELRKASWSEFDFDNRLWVIPAERMKKRRKHLVPLSDQAIEYLQELHGYSGHRNYLFPNVRRPLDVMSATTINRALEYMGYRGQFTGHGFRSTASTLLNEMGWRADVIERQLSHVEQRGERKAYNHAEYMDERKQMMQVWSNYLDKQESVEVKD